MATPLPYRIDPQARTVIVVWPENEEPELTKLRDTVERILADPEFAPGFGIVSDRRRIAPAPTPAFVTGFIDLLVSLADSGRFTGRWATVAPPQSPAVFGMSRMTELLSEGKPLRYRVFRDVDEATVWAGSEGPD